MIIKIDIHDVRRAGSVARAIVEWAKNSEDTASGAIDHMLAVVPSDYARRALSRGYCRYYVDDDTGWVYEGRIDPHEGQYVVCTERSVVCVVCPDTAEAREYPEVAARMAQSVIEYHHHESDRAAWAKLIRMMQAGGQYVVADIDADEIDE
jgi:hypothetical protein